MKVIGNYNYRMTRGFDYEKRNVDFKNIEN